MKIQLRRLLVLSAFAILAGCSSSGDPVGPDDGNDDDDDLDDDGFPAVYLFSEEVWPTGGRFNPLGTPPFDIPGNGTWTIPVDVPVGSSNPANGSTTPLDFDDIKYVGYAKYALQLDQINAITGAINSGRPTKEGDLVVLPSVAMLTPENEPYRFFQMNTQADMETLTRSEPGRTQVVGIVFGNGTGGYVPVAPYTDDTFAGALVWMKATRSATYGNWAMDQRDWRNGAGNVYATSLRLLIRGNSAVAIIKESELQQLGVTQFRWDTFSYTTNVDTEWSHDFTDWIAIP